MKITEQQQKQITDKYEKTVSEMATLILIIRDATIISRDRKIMKKEIKELLVHWNEANKSLNASEAAIRYKYWECADSLLDDIVFRYGEINVILKNINSTIRNQKN